MQRSFTSFLFLVAILALSLSVVSQPAMAQYSVKTLVSNTPTSTTSHTDPNLINAWGLARSAGSAFWVSDNATGVSTLYNGIGIPQSLIVSIPSADPAVSGAPTGIVFNGTQQFTVQENGGPGSPSIFLFATLDGTISGWNPTINLHHAVLAADNSAAHSVYTGLAISDPTSTVQFLYAADIANNRVDVYDSSFKIVNHLTDPTIPAGFAPYGIQDINGKVYVTFATNAPTGGFVDVFSEAGILLQRLVRNSQILNQPWGLALAPRNFGPFSGALLVGNNTPDGASTPSTSALAHFSANSRTPPEKPSPSINSGDSPSAATLPTTARLTNFSSRPAPTNMPTDASAPSTSPADRRSAEEGPSNTEP